MKKLILILMLITAPLYGAELIEWENLGGPPVGGVYDMEIDSEDNIYLASYNGVFKSTDDGNSWFRILNIGIVRDIAYLIIIKLKY